ncbi:MAG: hypothetical protein ACKO6A_05380 [Bacteroidota bacterium]
MEEIKMNNHWLIKICLVLFVLMSHSLKSYAQPGDNGNVIIIQGIGLREVSPASRLYSIPVIIDTNIVATLQEYPLLFPSYSPKANGLKIEEQKYPRKDPDKFKVSPFYAKVGIGSQIMPLGEFYFNSIGKSNFQYGVYGKHISSFQKMKDYAPSYFDRTQSGAFASYYANKFTISSSGHYSNYGFNYYGLQDSLGIIDRKDIAQRFQDAGGDVLFHLHQGQSDSSKLNLKLGVNYNYFTTKRPFEDSLSKWKAGENYVAFTSELSYRLGREKFFVNLNVFNNNYKYGIPGDSLSLIDTGFVMNDLILQFNPGVVTQMMNDKLRVAVGVDVSANIRETTKPYIYPQVEIKYSMFDNIFIPYVGIKGGLKQNTLRSLTRQNEFMLPNSRLLNESTVFDAYVGFKGVLSKSLSFNIGANYARVNNKALFISDTVFSNLNKFAIVYDSINIMTIEGSLSYQMNEKLKIDAISRFFSYETINQAYAWNLPQLQFKVRGNYVLSNKFIFNLDVTLETGRRALVFDSTITGALIENNQISAPLKTFADINLSTEYKFNDMISGFIQFNNLTAQRYLRWYNYPLTGFQIMGGATFKF